MKPYALNAGEGTRYDYGIPHLIKLGETAGRGAAIFELDTCAGEEPPLHTHRTEDEVFYVLSGEITFHCDGQDFPLSAGGFMFLPKGLPHGYAIARGQRAKLLVIAFPTRESADTWGGYANDVETQGTLLDQPK
jgi:quercetin dioxygenase-like cupin family protein